MAACLLGCGEAEQVDKTESSIIYVPGNCPSWVTGRYTCSLPSRKALCSYYPSPGVTEGVYGCKFPAWQAGIGYNALCDVTCNTW